MEDEEIIKLLFGRTEDAIRALDLKYGRLFRSVSFNILGDRQDAEECVSDAYLGIWNAIPPARPESLRAFALKIVRNLSLKRYKMNTAAKRNSTGDASFEELEECLSDCESLEDEIEKNELAHIIESFLDSLSKENRVIFMHRYWFCDSYAEIAKRTALSEKNVSVRLTRMRKRLQNYLKGKRVL